MIDERIKQLVAKYIRESGLGQPEQLRTDPAQEGRFLLEEESTGPAGKYSQVDFFSLKDRQHDSTTRFAVKENIGQDIAHLRTLTEIEYIIIENLLGQGTRVVRPLAHMDQYLMTETIPGETVLERITREGKVDPRIYVSMLLDVPKMQAALEKIINGGNGAISPGLVDFLKERPTNLIKERFSLTERDIIGGFFAFRVMQSVGKLDQEFMQEYRYINQTLVSGRQAWNGYGHPANRILPKGEPNTVVAYDFNHVTKGSFTLETAMVLSQLGIERLGETAFLNGLYLAVAMDVLNRGADGGYSQDCTVQLGGEFAKGILERYRENPTAIAEKRIDYSANCVEFYANMARVYAAAIHRTTLDMVRASQSEDQNMQARIPGYKAALNLLEIEATRLFRDLDTTQKSALQEAGIHLPISYKPFEKYLVKHVGALDQ